MDFRIIRPKKRQPTTEPPPQEMPPPDHHLPMVHAPHPHGHYPPCEFDHISRQQRPRSIEYSNARTWRMNIGDDSDCHYGNYEYTYQPFGVRGTYKYDPHNMIRGPPHPPPPPPGYHCHQSLPEYPPRMALPPPNYHQPPPDYTQRFGLPPQDYSMYGPMEPLPPHLPPVAANYYHYPPAPPHYGGLFSDENPNGCWIM